MSFAKVYTRGLLGLHAPAIEVEVHLSQGLPSLTIVGLAEAAVRESKDRVRSAIINSGFQFPTKRLTINLAPADLPKDGSRLDLAIALGILIASTKVCTDELLKYQPAKYNSNDRKIPKIPAKQLCLSYPHNIQ